MNFQLVIVKGPNTSKVLPVRTEVTTVGRQEDCQIRVVSSEVSRKHCQLLEKDGKLFVKDLNSSNGTFVNGRKIQDQQLLGPGAHLTVGPLTFRVDVLGAASPAAKPGDTAPEAPSPVQAAPAAPAKPAPAPAKEMADDDFALLLDDELGLSSSPSAASGGKAAPANDEFEIDFGDDPAQVTMNQTMPSKPASAPAPSKPAPAAKAAPAPAPPPPPTNNLPVGEVDEAVADFLFDLKLDE